MTLSPHFTLAELAKSQTALRRRIDNTPGPDQIASLRMLCLNVLEPIRAHYGLPVMVSSGFRSRKLNTAIGGARNSQHMAGQAADIEVPGISNDALADWIVRTLDYDQCIREFAVQGDPRSGWVHVSYKPWGNRKQVLRIG